MAVTINTDPFGKKPLKDALITKSKAGREALKSATMLALAAPPPRNDLSPRIEISEFPLSEIRPPRRQVRKYDAGDVAQIAQSIRQYGMSVPIVIDRTNRVINGAVVVEAARSLGMDVVPCVRLDHLTEDQGRALRVALNRIGHDRPYQLSELKLEFQELTLAQPSIEFLGFKPQEIDQVMMDEPELETAPPESDPDAQAITRLGDVWRLGEHILLCGDAKDPEAYATLLGEERVQLTLTDPPYALAIAKIVSTKHREFVEGGGDMDQPGLEDLITRSFSAINAALVEGGMLMSFMDWRHQSDLIVIGKKLGLELLNVVTWVKDQGGMGSLYRSQSEFVVVLKKAGTHKNNIRLGKLGRDRTNVWHVPGAGTKGSEASEMLAHHPTPKPVQMLADAILDVTDRGDVVLDPFAGSGSTLMASEKTKRRARLIELDPLYCDLIIDRWTKAIGERAIHADGRCFNTIREERLSVEEPDDDND